jgi:hypothetical protein
MTDTPPPGAFPHQHHDPRGLAERIHLQIRARIEEAVEMAALKAMVDARARLGRPAPETSNEADRREFQESAVALLAHLREAFRAELGAVERTELDRAEAGHQAERDRLLAGQVFLARTLPDYWQRFEAYRTAYGQSQLQSATARSGWRQRLFRRQAPSE